MSAGVPTFICQRAEELSFVPVSAQGLALTISFTLAPRPGSIVRCFAPTKCHCGKRRPLIDRSLRYCSNEMNESRGASQSTKTSQAGPDKKEADNRGGLVPMKKPVFKIGRARMPG